MRLPANGDAKKILLVACETFPPCYGNSGINHPPNLGGWRLINIVPFWLIKAQFLMNVKGFIYLRIRVRLCHCFMKTITITST